MGKLFTDEQIAQANQINILEYARQAGYTVEKITPKEYKIPNYGGLRINGTGSKWNSFTDKAGGGPIQFVMYMEKKSWVEAVKELLGIIETQNYYLYRAPRDIEKEKEEKGEFVLPEKNSTYKHVFGYLINTRKIDKDIVVSMVKDKKLYENTHRSCVFVGYDQEGTARYASVRSTNTKGSSYRGDVANSEKAFAFNLAGSSNTIRVFEAPIDALSYATFLKHFDSENMDHMLALGCLGDVALKRYLKDHPEINQIIFCLDNDQWGREALNRWIEDYKPDYSLAYHFPKGKDWNEDLVSFFKEMEQRRDGQEFEEEAEM
ncbi:MAG TPA: topoisomerase [Desulfosporosinus sp.]|nr:topoisomerase [Desulfosporosinus sp.]